MFGYISKACKVHLPEGGVCAHMLFSAQHFLQYSALRKNTATHELLEGGDCSHKIHQIL